MNIKSFATHEDHVNVVLEWFHRSEEKERKEFLETEYDSLHSYHHSLGRQIRNNLGLWEQKWIPEIVKGIDISESHPDAISMKIIQDVWTRLHQPN